MMTKEAREILKSAKTIAVIGFSSDSLKIAHTVPKYLTRFYKVYPVNPNASEIVGLKSFKSVTEIKEPIDIVNIFRPGKECGAIVREEILSMDPKPKMIWLQEGITNTEAKKLASSNNIAYVENECIYVVHKHLE